jgi:MFS family permease
MARGAKNIQMRRPIFFYGWIIVAISFISLSLVWGARSSFSVFYLAILKEFGWSRASAALMFSLFIFVYGLISPLSGWLIDRFGPRKIISAGAIVLGLGTFACSQANRIWHLYVFWGCVGAVGVSLSGIVPHAAVVSRWFSRKRGMALGIIASGLGLGSLLVIFVQYLINMVGWRAAYRLMGVIIIGIIFPLSALFQRSEAKNKGLMPDGDPTGSGDSIIKLKSGEPPSIIDQKWMSQEWTLSRAMATYRFWALFSCFFFFHGFAVAFLLAHQVAFVVDAGYSSIFAASIFSLYGITQTIGQAFGFINDRIGWERGYSLSCILSLIGIFCIFLIKDTTNSWLLYAYGIFIGIGSGLMIPAVTGAATDLFQGRHFGAIYGFITFGFGVGGAISSWLGGYLFDRFGNYKLNFAISMLSICIACCSIWIAGPRKVIVRRG